MSTTVVMDEFREKVDEIESYFSFIRCVVLNADDLRNEVSLRERAQEVVMKVSDEDIQKTLKASFFLLLYNLIESSMRSGIEVIYDHLERESVTFNELNGSFKRRILNDTKRGVITADHLHTYTNNCLEREIIKASYRSEKLFSGNIDHKLIKHLSEQYGFSCDTEFLLTKHGQNLRDIKDKRNDLAHGNLTFKEVGRNYTVFQLEDLLNEVVAYLETILTNIKNYIENKEYLHSN